MNAMYRNRIVGGSKVSTLQQNKKLREKRRNEDDDWQQADFVQ